MDYGCVEVADSILLPSIVLARVYEEEKPPEGVPSHLHIFPTQDP